MAEASEAPLRKAEFATWDHWRLAFGDPALRVCLRADAGVHGIDFEWSKEKPPRPGGHGGLTSFLVLSV